MTIRLTLLLLLLSGVSVAQPQTAADSVSTLQGALKTFRKLDAQRQRIRASLREAEVRAIRASIREGPRDEFETEDDYRRRLENNEKKRGEIAAKFYLMERDTLFPIENQIDKILALRFKADWFQLQLGPYDLENRRFPRVSLSVAYTLGMEAKRRSKKAEKKRFVLEAVAVLNAMPDDGRVFREKESSLQVEPMLCITEKGTIDFAREIAVREPETGLTGRITNCHKAWHKSPVTGMKLIYIAPGMFKMGSNTGDDDEKPVHEVVIPRGFFIGQTEVTQAQWRAVMGNNPSFFKGDDRPVENITYAQAQLFVKRLNELEKTNTYRLPTEAEWEYVCRAGKTGEWTFGNQEEQIQAYAWIYDNANRQTQPVAQKQPNAWGIYDMHGNVWEWVSDWYAADYYKQADRVHPIGPVTGEYRVLRGGSWNGRAIHARTANRFPARPDIPDKEYGLRIVKMED